MRSQYGSLSMGVTQSSSVFPPRCVVPDDGTIGFPGPCPWQDIPGQHVRLPVQPSTDIEMQFTVDSFFDVSYDLGGTFGPDGEIMTCQAILHMDIQGTGALSPLSRQIQMQVQMEVHWPCADPSADVRSFPNEMVQLQGEIFGDPDFYTLRVEAGSSFGQPSPGHTRRTRLPSGNFNVDSFFDVEYRITWQGCPGSIIEGFGNDPDDLCTAPLVQGGTPPLPGPYFGLPHQPLGNAVLGEDANCNLIVSNIGSSGEDGVFIDLGESSQGLRTELDLPAPGTWRGNTVAGLDIIVTVTGVARRQVSRHAFATVPWLETQNEGRACGWKTR